MKMYDGVLKRVRQIENKNLISYATTDGALYKVLKWIYIAIFAYYMHCNLAYMIGTLVSRGSGMTSELRNTVIIAGVCCASAVAALVLLLLKIYVLPTVLTAVSAAISCSMFAELLRDDLTLNGFYAEYYFRHLVPSIAVVLAVIAVEFIAFRAKIKTKKMYNRVVENLYDYFHVGADDAVNLTEEQWDAFLKDFDPYKYKRQFKNITADRQDAEETESEG